MSPERRNWRGIFIALLVIAAVFSLIIFSIFLLSPEDEGLRIRGRRLQLSDILGKSLQWKSFNGTWISDVELVFLDITGGLSILNLNNYTIRVLMTNSSFRQLNAESYIISPDQKYVLLQSDSTTEGSKYTVYDVQLANTFPLGPNENMHMQHIVWAPYINSSTNVNKVSSTTTTTTTTTTQNTEPTKPSFMSSSLLLSSLANNNKTKANGIDSDDNDDNINNSSLSSSDSTSSYKIYSSNQLMLNQQAIAYVYKNDIYYKPKVQGDQIYRITETGVDGIIYNGIPDWFYKNVPELDSSIKNSIAFSPNGLYMAFFTYNDSRVMEYKYTWMGENMKYPTVLTQRYAKAETTNPTVTLQVVNLSNLKNLTPINVVLPSDLLNDTYMGGLTWASSVDLAVTITNRAQSKASTVLCKAPEFHCQIIHDELTVNNGWVIPADRIIFSARSVQTQRPFNDDNNSNSNNESLHNITNGQTTYEISNGRYILKRLPVRDGEHGYFRHVVFISSIDKRSVPLTMGRFEVTEIVGWDEKNEIVYFMAAPEKRPGERHLYKISLKLNLTKSNRTYITSSQPTCLTCDNTAGTYNLQNVATSSTDDEDHDDLMQKSNPADNHPIKMQALKQPPKAIIEEIEEELDIFSFIHEEKKLRIPNNCLYNKIYFSADFSYYVQECLGPDSPSVYLVETKSNTKVFVLNSGDNLRHRLDQLALPQIRTFSVEIRHGFHAQVRLFLPPGMREDEEVAFPLILQVDAAPGSQLVDQKYEVDWNWYLASQRSMIVAQIDGRGSGYQGEVLRTQIHGKLGTVEIEDQLSVLTYLRDNLKFIDPGRICAYGWGYGGYATTMTLIEDSQHILQCVVAINPIVSFGHHYSFFTERYIPLSKDYLRALQQADLTMKAGNINGRDLMLIHGTADTLVHQEHTLNLVRSLVDQHVKFRHQVYPDEDHALSKSLNHLYKTIEWYFDECFGPADDTDWDPTNIFVFKQ